MSGTAAVWTPDPDGEYNEQSTILGGRKITIASDRDGGTWFLTVDDKDASCHWLEADNAVDARAEALREAAA